jgi:hypothetical protein
MKVFLLTSFAAFVALSAASPSGLPATQTERISKELSKLQQIVEERSKLLAEFLSAGEGAMGDGVQGGRREPAAVASKRREGLQIGGLATRSLQPAGGLETNSRGLSSEEQWRRMFPKKPNGDARN